MTLSDKQLEEIRRSVIGYEEPTYSNETINLLIDEIDRLRATVANWERKEIQRATCCDENAREVERLRGVVAEAIELAEEGWAYASDYFCRKWRFAERIEALRAKTRGET